SLSQCEPTGRLCHLSLISPFVDLLPLLKPPADCSSLLIFVQPIEYATRQSTEHGHDQRGNQRRRRGPSPRPLIPPLPQRCAPSPNRLAIQEPRQIVGQVPSTRITPSGVFLQAFEADRLEIMRDFRLQPAGRYRFLSANLLQGVPG